MRKKKRAQNLQLAVLTTPWSGVNCLLVIDPKFLNLRIFTARHLASFDSIEYNHMKIAWLVYQAHILLSDLKKNHNPECPE